MTKTEIRFSERIDLKKYYEHTHRLEAESGRSLETIFSPFEAPFETSPAKIEATILTQQEKSVSEVDWGRLWILTSENDVRGHIALVHRPDTQTSLHRATLMMGIERSHRSQGYGFQLMETAIHWAKNQPSLEWLELFVFSNNLPAIRLYKKFGFTEIGTTPDMFRVYGHKISDVKMVLLLDSEEM